MPVIEEVTTTRPRPDSLKAGVAAWTMWIVPVTLTPKIAAMSSSAMSAMRVWG